MRVRTALVMLVTAVAMVAACVWLLLWASLAPSQGRFALAGLGAVAQVRFDAWQRPYVSAQTLEDALQIEGWLHASHRLWQMELLRRAGSGTMAELLGPSLIETDRELWRAGVPQLAAKLKDNASPETLALVDHYLAGVNAAIQRYPVLPPELLLLGAQRPRWERSDVFAVGALTAFQSARNMGNELVRLALATSLDAPRMAVFLQEDGNSADYPFVISHYADTEALLEAYDRVALTDPAHNRVMPRLGFGSNGWVISGSRTASGVPLYAFDSHDELGLPNLFYEVHLFFAGGRQLRGWSVPGLPGVINGFNEAIAWGFTNIGDTQDLFLEERSGDDPLLFRDGDSWYRARTETVEIAVAGGEAQTLTLTHTRNGPLISEQPPISLAWAVHRVPRPQLDSLLQLNLALDWNAFTAALDTLPAPTLNATYADRHGTIGFRTTGVIPQRGAGNGLIPLDGAEPANRWLGLVDVDTMPERVNPPEGYLAAANARVNAAGDGPLVSADNAAPYRIERIQAELAAKSRSTVASMQRLQMDRYDGQAAMLLPSLLELLDLRALNEVAASAAKLLEDWSKAPVAAPDSAPALIFQQWYMSLAEAVFAEHLGAIWPRLLGRSYLLNQALDYLVLKDPDSVWWNDSAAATVTAALNSATEKLAQELGRNPASWRLDDHLSVSLQHEMSGAAPLLHLFLDRGPVAWAGGPSTVGRARYSYRKPFAVNAGATVRAVAEMSDTPSVSSVIPAGQSGHPLSPYYADQFSAWLAGELLPVATGPEELAEPTLRFEPTTSEQMRLIAENNQSHMDN